MRTPFTHTLIARVVSIGDPAGRVGLVRSLLPSIPPGELDALTRELVERAGMRDSNAQVVLLALAEAQAELRRSQAGITATRPQDEREGTDWGTGRPLTLGERKSLARKPERKILERAMRDAHPDVIAELLLNPRLTEIDVARMCSARDTRSEVLARVFSSPRWAIRPRVRSAIARNPRAPVEIALALVPMLGRGELRELAADTRIANAVRARALEVLRRLPPTPRGPAGEQ